MLFSLIRKVSVPFVTSNPTSANEGKVEPKGETLEVLADINFNHADMNLKSLISDGYSSSVDTAQCGLHV